MVTLLIILKHQKTSQSYFQHAVKVARSLERRWHHIWLRSLEWQCLLEQWIQVIILTHAFNIHLLRLFFSLAFYFFLSFSFPPHASLLMFNLHLIIMMIMIIIKICMINIKMIMMIFNRAAILTILSLTQTTSH